MSDKTLQSIDKSLKRIADVMEKRERREQNEHDYIKEQLEGSGRAEQEGDQSSATQQVNGSIDVSVNMPNGVEPDPDDLLEAFNQQYKDYAKGKDIRKG